MSGVLETVGDTPLVSIDPATFGIDNPAIKISLKLEGNNPAGSVKDRPALHMLQRSLDRKQLRIGDRVIEPTSGNTGIALAMAAGQLGIHMELVMPASASRERVDIMQAYGATVTLTAADKGMEGAIDYARERSRKDAITILDQFANPDNPDAHYHSTGPEIWTQTGGSLTHFVSAMGTTGTIMGVSRYLKEQNPKVEIVGVQPADGAEIPGIRRWPAAYLPKIFEPHRVDSILDVTEQEATSTTRLLATKAGIFCGMSGGGAFFAALQLAKEISSAHIVVILPDRGDRYLSTDLFADR